MPDAPRCPCGKELSPRDTAIYGNRCEDCYADAPAPSAATRRTSKAGRPLHENPRDGGRHPRSQEPHG